MYTTIINNNWTGSETTELRNEMNCCHKNSDEQPQPIKKAC